MTLTYTQRSEFRQILDLFIKTAHSRAIKSGFWDHDFNEAEKLALIHSEVSEVLEAIRHGDPRSEKIIGFSQAEEELADAVIRIFDLCGKQGYDLGGAIIAKLDYNDTRPYKHGKAF